MELMMEAAVGLALANSAVLLGLIFLYARITAKTRAGYSAGLMLFSSFLLLHNLLTVYAYSMMTPLFGLGLLPYLTAIGALEFAGLLVLLKLTV